MTDELPPHGCHAGPDGRRLGLPRRIPPEAGRAVPPADGPDPGGGGRAGPPSDQLPELREAEGQAGPRVFDPARQTGPPDPRDREAAGLPAVPDARPDGVDL